MPATALDTRNALDTPMGASLRAPQPLALPIKRGKMARIPERWTGPLSGAPFEAQVEGDGALALGVAFVCPKGQRRTGSLWLACVDGPQLVDRAMAIDAALAAALGRQTPDAKGRVGKIGLGRLLETLLWVEQGAGVAVDTTASTQPAHLVVPIPMVGGRNAALGSGPGSAPVRTSGARSLFADVAKSLKKTLAAVGNGTLAQAGERMPSAACH